MTEPVDGTARDYLRRRPHLFALALPAAAWVAILTRSGHVHGVTLTAWTLMSVAMMVPVVLPALRHVAVNSLRRRRQRAMATFLAGYLAVWVAAGAVLIPLFALPPPPVLLTAVLLFAALWLFLPGRRAGMRACHRTIPLPPTGWRATRGAARFGLWHGLGCLGVCGPLMAIMAVPGIHHPLWMIGVTAAVVLTRYPPRWRPGALVLDASYRLKG
ncbi:DUF2182 domain-containing protein [Actinoplanes solisilvae]|uniref:DUF2182 domain-containing protein n=1 Tax=Actinoplanes solisilvae TaxID=2486853 RepID=UPI000FD85988|nr:DUF2182 domain-containing protein [Actinoplanes solisilvae]